MDNRQIPPIARLDQDTISHLLNYIDPAGLNRVKAICSHRANPFLKSMTYAPENEKKRWQHLAAVHFSHFLDRRLDKSEITDWKKYFIECYENSYVALPDNVDVSRMVRLSILIRDGNITGLEKEKLKAEELEFYLETEGKCLYELAKGRQLLCDYLYNEIILPNYRYSLDKGSQLSFWACALQQPIERLKTLLGERHDWDKRPSLGIRLIKAALKIGSLEALELLYPNEPGCPQGVEWLKFIVAQAPAQLVKEIYEKDEIKWANVKYPVLVESLKNKDLSVFPYLFSNFEDSLTDESMVKLFKRSLTFNDNLRGNALAFKVIFNACQYEAVFVTQLMPIMREYLLSIGNSYPANDDILAFILTNTSISLGEENDFLRAKRRVITKHHSINLEYLLKQIYKKRDNKELSEDELFDAICGENHIENIFLSRIMLNKYINKIPANKKYQLFYYGLLAELKSSTITHFGSIVRLYNALKMDEHFDPALLESQLRLINIVLNSINPGYISMKTHWYIWDFFLSQQIMSINFNFHDLFLRTWFMGAENNIFKHMLATQITAEGRLSQGLVHNLSSYPTISVNGSDVLSDVLSWFPGNEHSFVEVGRHNPKMEASIFYAVLSTPPSAIKVVENFLKLGTSPNKRSWYLPLSIAIRNNRSDIYDLLIKYGASLAESILSTRIRWNEWRYAKEYFIFLVKKGVDLNVYHDDQDPLLAQFVPDKYDRYADEKEFMLNLFLKNGACIKNALIHLYHRDKAASSPIFNKVSIYKINYLLEVYSSRVGEGLSNIGYIPEINILLRLGNKIAKDMERPDNDCRFSFNYNNQQVLFFGQRTAGQKRIAEIAFLGVVLGVEEYQHLAQFQDDLTDGKLKDIYKDWLELEGVISIFSPKPSSSI